SKDAPLWMSGVLAYVVDEQGSLANELAYVAPDGTLYHCENGWLKGMFISSKITPQTRFRYASLTKLLTADAILELVNEKKLSLDTRMLDILSEFHPVVEPRLKNITIQHLLNHRAGFDRLLSQDPMTAHRTRPWCPDDLKRLLTLRLDFLPGSRYAYS